MTPAALLTWHRALAAAGCEIVSLTPPPSEIQHCWPWIVGRCRGALVLIRSGAGPFIEVDGAVVQLNDHYASDGPTAVVRALRRHLSPREVVRRAARQPEGR